MLGQFNIMTTGKFRVNKNLRNNKMIFLFTLIIRPKDQFQKLLSCYLYLTGDTII
jgi:hypothetical protein